MFLAIRLHLSLITEYDYQSVVSGSAIQLIIGYQAFWIVPMALHIFHCVRSGMGPACWPTSASSLPLTLERRTASKWTLRAMCGLAWATASLSSAPVRCPACCPHHKFSAQVFPSGIQTDISAVARFGTAGMQTSIFWHRERADV